MRGSVEKAQGGYRRKPLQPLDNHHPTITDVDTADEDIETVGDEGGVEVGGHRDQWLKVFQGRQVNTFVQGCLHEMHRKSNMIDRRYK